MAMEFETTSCICRFHVYQEHWSPIIGEQLECRCEFTNPRDCYAVAVCKGGETVGHMPRYCMVQNFDGENIDEFDEFLSIHQHFPIKIFC